MTSLRRALAYGFLVWLIPLAVSMCIFPIRESNRPLFESIMSVVLTAATASLLNLYFRQVERRYAVEGALLGGLWFATSLLLDQPLFHYGPMKMPFGDYMSAIGVEYLLIPAVCVPVGMLLDTKAAGTA